MRLLLAAALVCAASAGATASQNFCGAAFDGNLEAVKESIRDGVDVDYQCTTLVGPATALYIASYNGHTEVISVLLSHGADVNAVSGEGFHALYAAALNNHPKVVRLLSHFSAMTPPSWLGLESGEEPTSPRHEQASRRWCEGQRDDSARTRRKILVSTQVHASPRRRRSGSSSPPARRWRASRRARRRPRGLRRAGVSRRRAS